MSFFCDGVGANNSLKYQLDFDLKGKEGNLTFRSGQQRAWTFPIKTEAFDREKAVVLIRSISLLEQQLVDQLIKDLGQNSLDLLKIESCVLKLGLSSHIKIVQEYFEKMIKPQIICEDEWQIL